jgi:hypothetical protein
MIRTPAIAALALLLASAACGADLGPAIEDDPEETTLEGPPWIPGEEFDSTGMIVTFEFRDYPEDTMQVLLRNWAGDGPLPPHLRGYLDQYDLDDPDRPWRQLGVWMVPTPGIDPRYPWHFDPDRADFMLSNAWCVGGVSPMRTIEEMESWFEDYGRYCASARPIHEPRPSSAGTGEQ